MNFAFRLQRGHEKPVSVASTQQSEIHVQRETRVSVVTEPIIGSINSPRNVRINSHYGGILWDNYIPKRPPINNLESYEDGGSFLEVGADNFLS